MKLAGSRNILPALNFLLFYSSLYFQMTKKLEGQKNIVKNIPKCTICMETNAHVSIDCTHKFCMKCISKWVKRNQSCPLCRAEITEIKYGTRTKKVERRRRHRSDRQVHQPRPRFRITWKPVFFIGIPYMPSYVPNPFLFRPPLY